MRNTGYQIKIYGLVQGVGFRPYVFRIAHQLGILGQISNCSDGVEINVMCDEAKCDEFIEAIKKDAPSISQIIHISKTPKSQYKFNSFRITESEVGEGSTLISPDIAICKNCLEDRKKQPHRIGYPFTNCTYCGPRFSIIKSIPYDRDLTTMNKFVMCDTCKKEYENPSDRRFHAQPVACNSCGPHYSIYGEEDLKYDEILSRVIKALENNEIIALKSLGGYNLICNAECDDTVAKLREIKQRPRKPFAIMVKNTATAKKIASPNKAEIEALESWQRPITIMTLKDKKYNSQVAPLYTTIGIMLPYMAIHYDIFENSSISSIVVTSGNRNGEPIMIDDTDAKEYFPSLGIMTISYNREIYNRVDDSVVKYIDGKMRIIRKSRGYVPSPIFYSDDVDGIMGMGAEVISQFSIGVGNKMIQSQYLGDTSNLYNEDFYKDSLDKFQKLFCIRPKVVVSDLHPLYRTSIIANEIAKSQKIPLLKVQHHHAHAIAVMAEYKLDEDVIALVLDGTGLGTDKKIWGGEILRCSLTDFKRLYHLNYHPMPGGDIAAKEIWRMAVSVVKSFNNNLRGLPYSFTNRVGASSIRIIERMIETKTNCPLTSGAGRLFDAVSSLLGITDTNTYEAEAPILLEQIADKSIIDTYASNIWVTQLLKDINIGLSPEIISAKFHNTLAEALSQFTIILAKKQGLNKVVLCGGVMQNSLLANNISSQLRNAHLEVYFPTIIPPNDAAISVGQLVYGAHKIKS